MVPPYDKIELELTEFNVILPSEVVETLQLELAEQFIEKKYEPEDLYNVYLVMNRNLLEALWNIHFKSNVKGVSMQSLLERYPSFTECITSEDICRIMLYQKDKLLQTYSVVWSNTPFDNRYQKNGITDEKLLIHIKEL